MTSKFPCPHCNEHIIVSDFKEGDLVRCNNCGKKCAVPNDSKMESLGNKSDSRDTTAVISELDKKFKQSTIGIISSTVVILLFIGKFSRADLERVILSDSFMNWRVVLSLTIIVLSIFFLVTLYRALKLSGTRNRTMSPGLVWLTWIPFFGFIWCVVTVFKVSSSIKKWHKNILDVHNNGGLWLGLSVLICFALHLFIIKTYEDTLKIGLFLNIVTVALWTLYWQRIALYNKLMSLSFVTIQENHLASSSNDKHSKDELDINLRNIQRNTVDIESKREIKICPICKGEYYSVCPNGCTLIDIKKEVDDDCEKDDDDDEDMDNNKNGAEEITMRTKIEKNELTYFIQDNFGIQDEMSDYKENKLRSLLRKTSYLVICDTLEKYLSLYPSYRMYKLLSLAYYQAKHYNKSIKIAKSGINKYGDPVGLLHEQIGEAYLLLDNYEKAREFLIRSIIMGRQGYGSVSSFDEAVNIYGVDYLYCKALSYHHDGIPIFGYLKKDRFSKYYNAINSLVFSSRLGVSSVSSQKIKKYFTYLRKGKEIPELNNIEGFREAILPEDYRKVED